MEFERWRREVNIILNQILGHSLKDIHINIEKNVYAAYQDGDEPLDAAQLVIDQMGLDIEVQAVLEKEHTKSSKKNTKKQ